MVHMSIDNTAGKTVVPHANNFEISCIGNGKEKVKENKEKENKEKENGMEKEKENESDHESDHECVEGNIPKGNYLPNESTNNVTPPHSNSKHLNEIETENENIIESMNPPNPVSGNTTSTMTNIMTNVNSTVSLATTPTVAAQAKISRMISNVAFDFLDATPIDFIDDVDTIANTKSYTDIQSSDLTNGTNEISKS